MGRARTTAVPHRTQRVNPCTHRVVKVGPNVPRRYGSWKSEICLDCGAWRVFGHDEARSHMSGWQHGPMPTGDDDDDPDLDPRHPLTGNEAPVPIAAVHALLEDWKARAERCRRDAGRSLGSAAQSRFLGHADELQACIDDVRMRILGIDIYAPNGSRTEPTPPATHERAKPTAKREVDEEAEFAWKTLTSDDQRYVATKNTEADGVLIPNIGRRGGAVMKALESRGLVRREELYGAKDWMRTELGTRVYDYAKMLEDDDG